jgi:hypothetical protein
MAAPELPPEPGRWLREASRPSVSVERHRKAEAAGLVLDLYAPAPGARSLRHVRPGSAIVGRPRPDDPSRVRVSYEGNLYDAENLRTYEDRVRCAAGRLVAGYPTVATAVVPAGDLRRIGAYHYATDTVALDDPLPPSAWDARELPPEAP